MRLSNEEIEKIKSKYNVKTLWSWSRLEKARQSKNEFYLQYVKQIPGDRNDCVYGTMGGLCHDVLEKLYTNQLSYEEMGDYFDENWIAAVDIMNLKFDRNDSEKNRNIASKYRDNLELFFKNHDKIPEKYNVKCEQFILTKWFDDIIFQGYADAIYIDDDMCYNIIDFKTSTKYSASGQREKCGQLVCYALGIHQMLGIPIDKIKIAWNFLKYVTVGYEQANGKIAYKDVERRDIGIKFVTNVKMWLKKLGYEDKIDEYIKQMANTNSLECLPDDVRCKFKISDCCVYVNFMQDLIDYWKGIVKNTVDDINNIYTEYNKLVKDNPEAAEALWFDSIEDVEKESYYYATLSDYSANLNKSYAKYLEYLDEKKNGSNVGSEYDFDINAVVGNVNTDDDTNNNKDNNEIDMSWLDGIL